MGRVHAPQHLPEEHESADPAALLTRYGQLAAELDETRDAEHRW